MFVTDSLLRYVCYNVSVEMCLLVFVRYVCCSFSAEVCLLRILCDGMFVTDSL